MIKEQPEDRLDDKYHVRVHVYAFVSHERDLRFRVDKMSASGHELNSSFGGLTGLINSEGYDVRYVLSHKCSNITVVLGSR